MNKLAKGNTANKKQVQYTKRIQYNVCCEKCVFSCLPKMLKNDFRNYAV